MSVPAECTVQFDNLPHLPAGMSGLVSLTGHRGCGYAAHMRRTHLHLTEPQHARLRDLADRTGLNVAELVRRALDDFLGRQDGNRRPAEHRPTAAHVQLAPGNGG